MHRFPIVTLALWLFAIGVVAAFFVGSHVFDAGTYMPSETRAAPSTTGPAPAPALPSLSAIDFEPPELFERGRVAALREEAAEQQAPLPRVIVIASALNLRTQPTSQGQRVAALQQGEELELLATEGGWSQVRSSSGATGWAFSQYLEPSR